jgi:hypothetical protein
MSEPSFPPDHRNAPIDLWRRVREFLCECFGLFGEPQDLADRHTLTFKDYRLILPWLRAAEALIRRFLLIEASLLPPGPPAPRPAGASKRPATRSSHDLDLTNPNSWRVTFRGFSSPARGGSGSRRSRETKGGVDTHAALVRKLSPKFRSALPLALRFEAVLRAYNNPLPFARRLAARLHKAASLAKRILNDGWRQLRGIIERTLHDDLGPRVDTSVRQLCADSS